MQIKVKVIPDSKKEVVKKESDTTYRIMVKEPAERNQANLRIKELLLTELGLKKGQLRMISGHRSTSKIFSIEVNR